MCVLLLMQKDSWLIDYEATKNALDLGREQGAEHFVLLSAICVQKPLLEFQRAKLKFEKELAEAASDINYSIVRPTAFFKSLAGQVGNCLPVSLQSYMPSIGTAWHG
jgi:divinyl chlorophyllide a 8-vinyl-reductase